MTDAMTVHATSATATSANVNGSSADVSKRMLVSTRVNSAASTIPAAMPTALCASALQTMSRKRSPDRAAYSQFVRHLLDAIGTDRINARKCDH